MNDDNVVVIVEGKPHVDEPEKVVEATDWKKPDEVIPPKKPQVLSTVLAKDWQPKNKTPDGKTKNIQRQKLITNALYDTLCAHDFQLLKELVMSAVNQAISGNVRALEVVLNRIDGPLPVKAFLGPAVEDVDETAGAEQQLKQIVDRVRNRLAEGKESVQ